MSIIKNGKIIAGSYNVSSASDATEDKKGIIRIATDEEAKAGELTNVAVTPKQLAENGGGSTVDIDAYTKAETEALLDKKQDVLTPNAPIELSEVTLSNSYGYTYKEDGTMQPNAGASFSMGSGVATISSYGNYIDFPLELDNANNKFVMYPALMQSSGTIGYCSQALGKLDGDGNFYPIIFINTPGDNYNANSTRRWVATSLATNNIPIGSVLTKQGGSVPSSLADYLATGDNLNPYLVAFGFQKASATQINITSVTNYFTLNVSVSSNLVNEINCFRILNRGGTVDYTVKPQFIGLFQGSSTVATNSSTLIKDVKNALDGLLTNEVDIASYTTVRQIKLNYDDTLKVVDGKLSANLDTSSLVTTDANQTITGTKVFNESVQYSNPQYYKDVWIGQTGPGNFGLVFQSNNSPYEFYIYNQGYTASSLKVAGFEGGVKFADTVNFNSSIYDKDGNEIVGGNGGGSTVDTSNLVDLTTDQTITANKTIGYGKQLKLESGTTSYNGAVYGGIGTAGNMIIECQNDTGAIPESIIIGAQGTGSNYFRRGVFLSHPTDEAVYVGYPNYACKIQGVNDLKLWGGYKQDSYLTLSNDSMTYTKADGSVIDLLSQNTQNDNNTISVVEVYGNSSSGYRLWSDGYCEQWGRITTSSSGPVVVSFLKPFMDTNYSIQGSCYGEYVYGTLSGSGVNIKYIDNTKSTSINSAVGFDKMTTTSIGVVVCDSTSIGFSLLIGNVCWRASGYVS